MTKSTITREQLEEWVAQFDEDGGCDATDSQLEALIRQSLAAMDSEPVGTLSVRHMSYSGKKIGNQFGFVHSDAAMTIAEGDYPLYRHAQPVVEIEPMAEVLSNRPGNDTSAIDRALPVGTQLYRHAPPAPVVPETAHSSVVAEQLAHVLSDMKVTDHQRAVISCAVDRLNNVAQLLQLSPSALLVPEILDYQGAKELYNYLMTEEEINATVNAWNACRAAMLSGGKP
ncbi:hypothetical protein VBQ65_23945 [Klebsiella pneumoniae]|nr:hypothetical protein [Klebsiella pneumoniae]